MEGLGKERHDMGESFPMTGGNGYYSYFKNSDVQRTAVEMAKSMILRWIIEHLDLEEASFSLFTIADLGCASGPNTFIAVDNIVQGVINKYKSKSYSNLPEFQVYFNDHTANDFNTLFANLPSDLGYFAAGVPGSFHGRLFPKSSLNFVYSSSALQWLSRTPKELSELNSSTCNKGRIHYANASNEVGKAYSAQYAKDMECFLAARAEEIAPGGLMAMIIPSRPDGTLPSQCALSHVFSLVESSIIDMVNEGIVSKDQLDLFNLPLYSPSEEELRALVEKNGYFSFAEFETHEFSMPLPSAEFIRAALENLIRNSFGSEITEQIFDRYSAKFAEISRDTAAHCSSIGFIFLLKRRRI
ncbi:loganic acid O-methyltransferase [Manihot esculenta]|uniref:Uncharacterized protein n=1 Tax=Manihot esculenta TaxID=3983 RepID=A0A2C9VNA7_MANES|nr:loganic acid O-methyltransferase [Manihot esculenta]OAY46557.1 hypothetical protein MANES_06G008900v8 [Manihot esculenta]